MEANIEFQALDTQKNEVPIEQNLITERYNFLLSEQPKLQTVAPQKFITSVIGGCVATLIPIYIDYVEPIQEIETLCGLLVAFFVFGTVIAHAFSQFMNDRNEKKVLVQNIELLQNWKRPIIILPENRSDCFVDARAKEITDVLDDEKCINELHIALQNAEILFDYAIEYGFRTGEKCQTNRGLPIVSLFPELFILRGAFDEKVWFEFQKEAVRIALEIDNEFAKHWYSFETEKYRAIAGGQLVI